jgi:uncharacterized protein YjbI with pentapeptide repeats
MIAVSSVAARWPTPYEIWDSLKRGLPIDLPEVTPQETAATRKDREIAATWIDSLVERTSGVVAVPVVIRNAIIKGDLRLRYVTFQHDLRIERCLVEDVVDLSFCVFSKAAVFDRSKFQNKVFLNGVRSQADLEWTATEFDRELECKNAEINGNLFAQGAIFKDFDLEGTSIGGLALFKDEDSSAARFRGEATFDLVQINGGLQIQHAEFEAEVTFTAATIKNFADFSDVVFRGKTQFDGASVLGDAKFDRAQFLPTASPQQTELIRFPSVRITGQAIFDDCTFGGAVRFDQIRFEAEAFFESAKFSADVRFDGALFSGPARFNGASFAPENAKSRIHFRGAKAGNIDFTDVRFLCGIVSFEDADFRIVHFRADVTEKAPAGGESQFPLRGNGELDLRGFTYERVFIAWREALDILEPYDVQPYRQMERAFRTMGEDHAADEVYLGQRWRAFRNNLNPPTRWVVAAGQLTYGLVARFGVRPWRLAGISILLLLCSVWVFNKPSAVLPIKDSVCTAHTLDNREALGVSLNYFLPVQVPVSVCWVATNRTACSMFGQSMSFALWASILKLLGWILVPLGVAALGGLLRQPPAK